MGIERTQVTIHHDRGFEAPCEGGGTLVFGGSVEVETAFELLERELESDQMIRVTTAIGDRDGARWEAEEIIKAGDLFREAVKEPVESHTGDFAVSLGSWRTLVKEAQFYCDYRDSVPVIVWRRVSTELQVPDYFAFDVRMKYFSASVSLLEKETVSGGGRMFRVLVHAFQDCGGIRGGPGFMELMPVSGSMHLSSLIWQDAYYLYEEEPGLVYYTRRRYPRMPILRRGTGSAKRNERIVHRPAP